jgi:hypothetical protein
MNSRTRAAIEHDNLERAVLACQRALADYRAGLLDEHEFRVALERAGLVLTGTFASDASD